ncbi:kinase-like protein [Leucogyrophana mollusca]|uniref:Kinase-like protein n=1 Tax=Leucogyrophana mollusca TaxID=85980 RepID=A0ACB8BT83_9AGAM|nr:kinase-like protein [Leucogyrophana mollusca]
MQQPDPFQPPDLTAQITRSEEYASNTGGFADVWKGIWNTEEHGSVKVAIKALRPQAENDQERRKKNRVGIRIKPFVIFKSALNDSQRLRRELRVWKGLRHPNIVPLLGVTSGFGPYTAMVCPWMEHGTLGHYLENSALTQRQRYQLLYEAAQGLSYLHMITFPGPIIHGDLTASNILIDSDRRACLADFGLSTILLEHQSLSYFTSALGGAVRYTAPEMFPVPDNADNAAPTPKPTKQSDVYSFGSIMFQVLSGKIPYPYISSESSVLLALSKGIRPHREPGISDASWEFVGRCWQADGGLRPTTEQAVGFVDYHRFM